MKNYLLTIILITVEITASTTMMMPQTPNPEDGSVVMGGSGQTETGYQIPEMKLFKQLSAERQQTCLRSTAVKLATDKTSSFLASKTEIETHLQQLKTLVDHYTKTPQFCLQMPSPSLIVSINQQAAKAFRAGNTKTFEAWYKRFEIDSVEIFSALDALTIKFAKPYALKQLKEEISKHPDVEYVENNAVFGGGPDSIQMKGPGIFVFQEGWGDCMAGCIHGRRITLQINGKKVEEIENRQW